LLLNACLETHSDLTRTWGGGNCSFELERMSLPGDDLTVIAEKIPGLKDLSPEEKLILVGELWDELAARPDAFPPREDHIRILRQRLDAYRENPESATAWEDVRARILASR
jgi:putative addiction module component (TIGR02574 family)